MKSNNKANEVFCKKNELDTTDEMYVLKKLNLAREMWRRRAKATDITFFKVEKFGEMILVMKI